uniref:Uncharacterized protein n=1 Tax=viral metagenome TaxID=1070528 RepID=A0A6H1ZS83_9ZZZZ
MSLYQFSSYMDEISNIEKMFSGGGSTKEKPISTEELIKGARQKGLKVPKHY